MQYHLLGRYCTTCLTTDERGFGEWRGIHGILCNQDAPWTCSEWTGTRRWAPHMKKPPLSSCDKAVKLRMAEKKNESAAKEKEENKEIKRNKALWIAELSDEGLDYSGVSISTTRTMAR